MELYLAPMAEITTPALRRAVRMFSPETVLCSEMLHAGSILSGAVHNRPLSAIHSFDPPIIMQILGNDPQVMSAAASKLASQACAGIDINMACPAPDIVKTGGGSMLLKDPVLAASIVRAVRGSMNKILSVKIRCGYESYDELKFIDFIKMLEAEGADRIVIHPRWAKLFFTRTADWKITALAKKHVAIPVIGNGDITSPETAVWRMKESGCDGIMIGREAVKSPWIFRLCEMACSGAGEPFEVDLSALAEQILGDLKSMLPEELHKSRGHRFSLYFSKNVLYAHELFRKIRGISDPELMAAEFTEYFERNPAEKIIRFGKSGKRVSV